MNRFESLGLDPVQGFDQIHTFIDLVQNNQDDAKEIADALAQSVSSAWISDKITTSIYAQKDIVRIMHMLDGVASGEMHLAIIEYVAFIFNCLLNPLDGVVPIKKLNILCDRPEGYEMVLNILSDLTKS